MIKQRSIILNGRRLDYLHRKNKLAKRLIISVKRDASVVVTTPKSYPLWFIEKNLQKQADWLFENLEIFEASPARHLYKNSKVEYQRYKWQAHQKILELIEKLNRQYQFGYNKISIRAQNSRWGSCSSKRNLQFNYKLIFLPEKLIEYVVVHELCHLKEMNHSKQFWLLVEKTIPDYKDREAELRSLQFGILK